MNRLLANRSAPPPILSAGPPALFSLAGTWLWKHRRSSIVANWRPSSHQTSEYGPLAARAFGEGSHTTLLLHGLGATGDYWSSHYDALASIGRVVGPDLLGFGRSMDMRRNRFNLQDHLDALEACLAEAAPNTKTLTIVAHSMGTGLAIAYAGRVPVSRLVCIGAPLFSDRQRALEMIGREGFMARLLLLDPTWAERFCALNCAHRGLAGFLAAAMAPAIPVSISRQASLHSWAAYRDSLEDLVLSFAWQDHLGAMGETSAEFLWGSDDKIGDRSFAQRVLHELDSEPSKRIQIVRHHGHHLAITDADRILSLAGVSAG